jgi:hypothetical protein
LFLLLKPFWKLLGPIIFLPDIAACFVITVQMDYLDSWRALEKNQSTSYNHVGKTILHEKHSCA